jgi:hypothetical protein
MLLDLHLTQPVFTPSAMQRPAFVEEWTRPQPMPEIWENLAYANSVFPHKSITLGHQLFLERQIDEFESLLGNWDGYDALPINQNTAFNARSALPGLLAAAPVPDITPNPNGTLSFEWEIPTGSAHLEIGQSRISFYLIREGQKPIFINDNTVNIGKSTALIGNLVSTLLFNKFVFSSSLTNIRMSSDVPAAA